MLIALVFLGLFAAVGYYAISIAMFAMSPLRTPGAVVVVQKGLGPKELTRILTSAGVVRAEDDSSFILLGKLTRRWHRVKAGEYQFTSQMTPLDAFRVLTSGISVPHPLTVREGENIYEIADALNEMGLVTREKFLKTVADPKLIASLGFKDPMPRNLEGYLFPDTYFLNHTMSAEDIVKGMVHKFTSVWTADYANRAKELGMTRHEIVTLASMIEKETGAQNERPIISSVFYNRLKIELRLQSDPTTIYGIWDHYKGNITKADLLAPTAYNTYTIPALPAGPISNPGKEALYAALYPAQSDFLYFVSHNDGTHQFSKSYDDHVNAVRKFQLDPKAREGKSWRDLSKKNKLQNKSAS